MQRMMGAHFGAAAPAGTVMVLPGDVTVPALRRELSDAGIQLSEPSDAHDAIPRLPDSDVDLVLVEPVSAERVEALLVELRRLGSVGDSIPIVVMVGYDMRPLAARSLFGLGAADVILPPHHPALVVAKIRSLLALKRRLDEARELSMRDELTGLYNRRFFHERLEQEVARSLRTKLPMALILFDADHFKAVNDTFGHPVGDRVLRAIADSMQRFTRKSDVLARIGGDEFALLLSNNTIEGAERCAELARERLQQAELDLPGDYRVTCSWGVASFPHPRIEDPLDDLVKEADLALLRAKAEGRDRIAVSGTTAEPAVACG